MCKINKNIVQVKAFKLELESYSGNLELRKIYSLLINSNNKNSYIFKKDLNRINGNIVYIESFMEKLSSIEKDFICDAFLNVNINIDQIIYKYDLSRSEYYRWIDKIICKYIDKI